MFWKYSQMRLYLKKRTWYFLTIYLVTFFAFTSKWLGAASSSTCTKISVQQSPGSSILHPSIYWPRPDQTRPCKKRLTTRKPILWYDPYWEKFRWLSRRWFSDRRVIRNKMMPENHSFDGIVVGRWGAVWRVLGVRARPREMLNNTEIINFFG